MICVRLLVACCLLWLCACDRTPARKVIWHMGDSTASQVGPQLESLARSRDPAHVVVEIARVPGFALGKDLDFFVERIRAARARLEPERPGAGPNGAGPPGPQDAGKPDLVLIQLGSNDLKPDGDPAVFALLDTVEELDAAIASLLDALPPGVPVLWIEPGPFVEPDRRSHLLAALQRAGIRTLRLPDALYSDGIHFADDAQAATAIVAGVEQLRSKGGRARK